MDTVLIADSSPDFRLSLSKALEGRFRVRCCAGGREALELLGRLKPRVLVLDLTLPELDGFGLVQRTLGLRPRILATTPTVSAYVVHTAEYLGIDYIIRKPCDMAAVVMRVDDLCQYPHAPYENACLAEILRSLDFSVTQDGYRYILAAVSLTAKDPGLMVTKELYPEVCDLLGLPEPKNVERDIRYAIKTAWDCGGRENWKKYFPHGRKPTNAQLIRRLAEVVEEHRASRGAVGK